MRKRVIYGYGMENGSITVNADQREIIQRVYNDYISGSSIRQIMLGLNTGDALSADGKTWTHGAVGRLLNDRRYLGDGPYPAIIPEEIFTQAQEKRRETNQALGRVAKAEREKPVYDGKIFCGHCGRRLYWIHYRGKVYWECSLHYQGKRAKGGFCGNARQLTDAEIQKAFILLQNRIFDGAVTVQQPQIRSTKRLSALKAKYREMLADAGNYEEKSLADIILWIAAEEYAQTAGMEDKTIIQAVEAAGRTSGFQADVFQKIVRKIIVTETELSFELINGQKIRSI